VRPESGKIRFLTVTRADLAAEVKTNMSEDMVEHGLPVEEAAKQQSDASRTVFRSKNADETHVDCSTSHARQEAEPKECNHGRHLRGRVTGEGPPADGQHE
jgi:hypothetical protein